MNRLDTRESAASTRSSQRERLSDREKEVLKMVACGYTSPEIEIRLAISGQTVNTHTRSIYHKLQVRTRAQAASCATERGLL
jgi:DNA-binding NarL/FixJ family response regulator